MAASPPAKKATMTPARFHLDESVDGRVAALLRQRDRECSMPNDVGLLGASDEEQLAFAGREGRVLVTRDEDFAALHYQGAPHAGVVLWQSDRHFAAVFRDIDQIASERGAEGMVGRIVYL